MSYSSPTVVVGAAFLDEVFGQALLTDPRHALTSAHMELAPGDWVPFLGGASSIAELAHRVYVWEKETGRAEPPLLVPALEHRLERVTRSRDTAQEKVSASRVA